MTVPAGPETELGVESFFTLTLSSWSLSVLPPLTSVTERLFALLPWTQVPSLSVSGVIPSLPQACGSCSFSDFLPPDEFLFVVVLPLAVVCVELEELEPDEPHPAAVSASSAAATRRDV